MIYPSAVFANRGATVPLSVTANDSTGASIVPDSVRWASSDTAKATVSVTGVLRTIQGTRPTVTIQATAFKGRAQGSGKIPVEIAAFP
ncbi:MAG TPA: Ig-like domain-containing protein [Gemmatimonadaceae bacterium]|nr:Ig-like domain-containing protein [Gemmatimonadaceae bacterium]